jgi:Domain of unknown function (DUF222)
MSVQQLRPPVMAAHLAAARVAVDGAAGVPIGSLSSPELPEALSDLSILEARISALKHDVLAEAEERELARKAGATGTDAWAAKLTGTTRGVMSGGILLARLLREKYHPTREAFAAGGINEAQMRVIVRAAERIPSVVTGEEKAQAEAALVAKAVEGMNPRRLRQAGRRMLDVISRRLADQQEADSLDEDEKRAEAETWLNLQDNGDGTFSGRFIIPELQGALLLSALERLSAPRRCSINKAGQAVIDPTVQAPGLNYTERLGAAFCELLEHLPADWHGSVAATLLIHLDYQRLLDGLAAARLDTGVKTSVGEARRLACNAGILPVVFGGKTEPLDVGREQRLHTKAQRRVLATLYDTCAAEGCERPFSWTEIHHPESWASGGKTSLKNALPLCGWHHRRAHDNRFTMRRLPRGEVRFRRLT